MLCLDYHLACAKIFMIILILTREFYENALYMGRWQVLFKAHDRNWHLFGIMGFKGGAPNERYFVHGVGSSLLLPMREEGQEIDRGTLEWNEDN